MPSAILYGLSPLISRIHFYLFSDWRRAVSSKFFDTQISSISTEKLVLPHHARCVLSRLCCNGHSLLLSSYLSRIAESRALRAAPADTRPRIPLISFCAVHPRTICAARSLATLSLRPLGSCPAFGVPWSSAMPPSLGTGRVATTTPPFHCTLIKKNR